MSATALRPGMPAAAASARPRRPRQVLRTLVSVLVVLVIAASFWGVDLSWSSIAQAPASLLHIAHLMFGPPNWSQLPEALGATMLSVAMAWFGTVLGIVISFPLSLLATRGLLPGVVRWPVRAIFAVLRAVPEVVIAVLMLSVTGLTAFTGALAIAIGSIGTLGKWGFETFEAVDRGAIEAATAAGGSRVQVMRWGVWPAAQPEVLAFWLYRFEVSVRASAILGLIGAGGIGKMLVDNTQFRVWDTVGTLLIVVVVVTMIIDQLSGMVRQRIITGRWQLPLAARRGRRGSRGAGGLGGPADAAGPGAGGPGSGTGVEPNAGSDAGAAGILSETSAD
ncbi:MAG TPA: phosphonate ABC transporter, permease protein PhnE [Gryllotalpicola sp.]